MLDPHALELGQAQIELKEEALGHATCGHTQRRPLEARQLDRTDRWGRRGQRRRSRGLPVAARQRTQGAGLGIVVSCGGRNRSLARGHGLASARDVQEGGGRPDP